MDEESKPVLTYEETPILDPIPEATHVFQDKPSESSVPPQPAKPKGKRHIGTVFFVFVLFGLGVWLSSQLRSFFAPAISDEVVVPTLVPIDTTAPPTVLDASPSAVVTPGAWANYQVTSGGTKKAIEGISYQLPREVKAPACDSGSCSSLGTNLPGGTRFTVAPRGKGQLLPDFRGAILTDASGREFTMKQIMIGSAYVYEYTGDFTGRTGGGYAFTKIRGVLVPVSETLAIEFNHFSPAGITTDFEKDDELFDQIIKTFNASDSARLP